MPFRPIAFTKDSFICDPVSAVVLYYGFYRPNNSGTTINTATAQFLIARETRNAGGTTLTFKYAGNDYNQIWDNRAALSYD